MDDSLPTARERLLLDRIRLGESSHLGFKAVQFAGAKPKGPDRKTLADELAAFANADGGVLVLGVDDKSRGIVGIPEDRVPQVSRSSDRFARTPSNRRFMRQSNRSGFPLRKAERGP